MYKMKIKLSNNEFANIDIEKPELIYGATAVVSNELDSSLTVLNPVTNKTMPIININEETGYNDVTITDVSKIKVVNHFYAGYKGVNRNAYLSIVFGKLNTDSHEKIDEKEQAKHQVVWIKKENLKDYVNNELNVYALNILNSIDKKDIYTGDGVMITDDENNSLSNIEVRNRIIDKYCN